MGFFSDLKEDLAQAVNELTEDNTEKELLAEEERLKRDLAAMESEADELEAFIDSQMSEEVKMSEEAEMPEDAVIPEDTETMEEYSVSEDAETMEEYSISEDAEAIEEYRVSEDAETPVEADETDEVEELEEIEEADENNEMEKFSEMMETAEAVMKDLSDSKNTYTSVADENTKMGIIPAGMIVTGDVTTEGGLDLSGTVLGNIEIGGKLNISGSIQGNAHAMEVFAQAAKITGDISCDNSVKIGPNAVVIGNISATSAVIAGAVKGDIDVKGPIILDSSAVIMGNLKSKSVQINNGAVIEGMCSQCYADVNPSSFFDEIKK